MAPPSEKLAGSLDVLRSLQERRVVAVRAADLAGYRNAPVYIQRSMHPTRVFRFAGGDRDGTAHR